MLSDVIKRRGPNPTNYQLHFDDFDQDDNGNETVLAQAPSAKSPNTSIRGDTTIDAEPNLESTSYGQTSPRFNDDTLTISGSSECETPKNVEIKPSNTVKSKGVKFNMDVNDSKNETKEGELFGSFDNSTLPGDDEFTFSKSK